MACSEVSGMQPFCIVCVQHRSLLHRIKRETARWAVSPSFCIHQRIYGRTMVSTIAATRAMTITADTVFFCFGLIISTYLLKSLYLRFQMMPYIIHSFRSADKFLLCGHVRQHGRQHVWTPGLLRLLDTAVPSAYTRENHCVGRCVVITPHH